jgi:hypothetical protein
MATLATMDHVSVAVGAAALILVYTVYRRYTSISLADVPGPEPASFIMGTSIYFCWVSPLLMWPSGNTKELYQGQVGDADFKWQAQYGNVVRFKGTFGVCYHILNCNIYSLICADS